MSFGEYRAATESSSPRRGRPREGDIRAYVGLLLAASHGPIAKHKVTDVVNAIAPTIIGDASPLTRTSLGRKSKEITGLDWKEITDVTDVRADIVAHAGANGYSVLFLERVEAFFDSVRHIVDDIINSKRDMNSNRASPEYMDALGAIKRAAATARAPAREFETLMLAIATN